MKLRARIIEETSPQINTMIVVFEGDKKKQHFEIKCSFNPHTAKFRKWDVVLLWVKWESEIFIEPNTGNKSYFTHLTCDNAFEISDPEVN